ncbi:MAG: DUF3160 domain-containing protein, partial [Ignavibacteriae bacterium]|nr:DUF3160 domain-containing protein [Ignavibacteriota bacterium]
MKTLHKIYFTIILFYFFNISLFAQFNTDSYKQFLTQNENLTTADLLKMHNAGFFFFFFNANWQNALFSDSIEIKYELTEDEINLINKNGFAVSERLQQPSFGAQFTDIYHKDLPVYISSDAILHAFHTTYDKILKDIELNILIGKLD